MPIRSIVESPAPAAMRGLASRSVEAASVADVASARVQTLRGAACMLLVAYHVIGGDADAGLRVADASILRGFANLMLHLRMPLFTFLSGFVYAYRPLAIGQERLFAKKKLLRLGVPLVTVSTLFFVVQQLSPGVNSRAEWSELLTIYVLPFAHFWFLQAILILFAVVAVLDRFSVMRSVRGYALVCTAVLALHLSPVALFPNVLSVNQAIYLSPFFFAGLGANRFRAHFHALPLKWIALAVFVVTMTTHGLACFYAHGEIADQRSWLGTSLSLSGLLVMLYWIPVDRTFSWIGGFSFSVYLYHVFFTSAFRTVLNAGGISDTAVQFAVGCAVGIVGPIGVELVLRKSGILSRLFLGQPPKQNRRPRLARPGRVSMA